MRRWRGLKKLVHDAIDHTTDLVEETHESVARKTLKYFDLLGPIGAPARAVDQARRLTTAGVFATIHGVNRAVEVLTDESIDLVEQARGELPQEEVDAQPMRSDMTGHGEWLGDAALGTVNGVIGDYLHEQGNALDMGMSFRHGDQYLPLEPEALSEMLPEATHKIAVFVHGLCCTEWAWCIGAEEYYGDPSVCFGTLLRRDLGFTPLYVRYNSGRHIADNGQLLAEHLERLLNAYPIDVDELVLIGHSMGGLVIRSACDVAKREEQGWLGFLSRVVFIASPHDGAPLEKLGNLATSVLRLFDTPGTQIPAKVIDARSAGIKDLRNGVGDEVPLLDTVAYCFLAATVTEDTKHPIGQLFGDMLVRLPSATAPATRHESFRFETHHFGGISHLATQNHPDIYEQTRRFCSGEVDG